MVDKDIVAKAALILNHEYGFGANRLKPFLNQLHDWLTLEQWNDGSGARRMLIERYPELRKILEKLQKAQEDGQ